MKLSLKTQKTTFANSLADLEITSPGNGVVISEGTCYITGTVDTFEQMVEQLGDAVEVITETGQILRADLYKYGSDPSEFMIEVPVRTRRKQILNQYDLF
jgi:hypothetical protein